MKPENRFWWFAAISITITLAILASILLVFIRQLTPEEIRVLLEILRKHGGYLFGASILVMAAVGFALDAIFHNFIIPINKLTEETILIHSVNPSHRIRIEGSRDIVRLVSAINEGAARFDDLQNNVNEKIEAAKADAEDEKNIMATFMSELPQGILICNSDGDILLYNKRAKSFFSGESDSDSEGRLVGLGRSIFHIIDKPLIMHAIDDIATKLRQKKSSVESSFILVGKEKKTLQVEVVPGIPALCAGASLLGAPLTHDFAVISLSDLLTPWEVIEQRIEAAAKADFVIVIYNPKSKKRNWQLGAAQKIILRHRDKNTPVGIVSSAMRKKQQVEILSLEDLDTAAVNMQTTVFVGSSASVRFLDFMLTPRGYSKKYRIED